MISDMMGGVPFRNLMVNGTCTTTIGRPRFPLTRCAFNGLELQDIGGGCSIRVGEVLLQMSEGLRTEPEPC